MTYDYGGGAERGMGRNLLAEGLIALVVIIILTEEILVWFIQKPVGGLLTLAVAGILGYVYFSG